MHLWCCKLQHALFMSPYRSVEPALHRHREPVVTQSRPCETPTGMGMGVIVPNQGHVSSVEHFCPLSLMITSPSAQQSFGRYDSMEITSTICSHCMWGCPQPPCPTGSPQKKKGKFQSHKVAEPRLDVRPLTPEITNV